jgi:hypothetical protein
MLTLTSQLPCATTRAEGTAHRCTVRYSSEIIGSGPETPEIYCISFFNVYNTMLLIGTVNQIRNFLTHMKIMGFLLGDFTLNTMFEIFCLLIVVK